ncbi:hypothetical protein FVEN_g12565 [Fusarium venenatum]|uniref:Uncharacterized protein n=1 Tax=Fusarium venenatum TaxID=56646 RepID=A0A2L2T7C2_9HYPO|nr:uncharacterized protein FVRRES_03276 [Fusarium venenatum]KAG8349214.1 hypothetical protein FVEN_g12565 [Fusarium venenatum]KAH7003688.1 hypothetical protein EDB82DRAFT_27896 [Fusarium venenatum]CEI66764.1 unnamed protein product [Fusarium venenatum]
MEAATGSRLLGEIEEMSLEEMLRGLRSSPTLDPNVLGLRTQFQPRKLTHISPLDEIAAAHFHTTKIASIGISGRHLPLLYKVVSNLVSPPHLYAILIIDIEGRFDATRLHCSPSHMRHVYVQRPARNDPEHTRTLVAEAEGILLYGDVARASAGREWWGTIVVGGLGSGDISANWKGWLRVDREGVRGFALGISAQEALDQKKQRHDVVDMAGWAVTSQWGGYTFKDGGEDASEEDTRKGDGVDNIERVEVNRE